MNLDLDDPLGDLLSDGSNDSLFGVEPAKKTATTAVTSNTNEPTKKMEQLFGISEKKTDQNKLKSENPSTTPINPISAPTAMPRFVPPTKSPTKSNESSELGFDPKQTKKKGSILDDLLGITANESLPKPPSSVSKSKAPVSRQTTSETNISEQHLESTSTNAPPPRKAGRRQSAVVFSDPLGLGLFGEREQSKKNPPPQPSKSSRKSIAGSEWLFADQKSLKTTPNPLTKLKSSPNIEVTFNSSSQQQTHEDEQESSNVTSLESKSNVKLLPPPTPTQPQMMESLAVDTQNTLNNLRQQEFQVMIAAQMKTQENVLIEMKSKQQELLKQQENQFNELLRKQIVRQSELEEIIKNQQERINSHINALISSQAHIDIPYVKSTVVEMPPVTATTTIEKIELESDVKRLEMEKLRLEDLLSNVNDNHEKEIILIESSYKKCISLMEENFASMEHRYKSEIASLEKFFNDKIKSISEERENVVGSFEAKIKVMEESHQNFIDKLKTSYDNDLEMLRTHYEEMMQNIRKSKFMEFAIREESLSCADMMKRASSNLENASGDIQSLHEVLQEKLNVFEHDREAQLSAREKRLEEQQKLLERAREASEVERKKLLELVYSLEFKLNAIEQKSEEEQWSLKEKLMAFEVERKSFEKEKEFLRNQIAIEQQKVQEQKQSQLSEYAKSLKEIEDERSKLQEERTRCEIAKTLQIKNVDDKGRSRAEIEIAVKCAEDAAKDLENEKEHLIKLQQQLEVKRREMMDRENAMRMEQSELERLIMRVKQKEVLTENSMKQAKRTEVLLMAKYQSLQKYTMEMSERDNKIAKERLDLNAEKMEFELQRKKILENRCSLCKADKKVNELKNLAQLTSKEMATDDFDNLNSMNDERATTDYFNFNMNDIADDLPNLVDMSDETLDSDLLMLKFNVLNYTPKS